MRFSDWFYFWENQIEGGITRLGQSKSYTGSYFVQSPTGGREFTFMFTHDNGGIHINLLSGKGDDIGINIDAILEKFAQDICRVIGPIDPRAITWTSLKSTIHGRENPKAEQVRDRLFQRYLRQLKLYLSQCQHTRRNQEPATTQSRYANHPFRAAWKGSDEEFARVFGDK